LKHNARNFERNTLGGRFPAVRALGSRSGNCGRGCSRPDQSRAVPSWEARGKAMPRHRDLHRPPRHVNRLTLRSERRLILRSAPLTAQLSDRRYFLPARKAKRAFEPTSRAFSGTSSALSTCWRCSFACCRRAMHEPASAHAPTGHQISSRHHRSEASHDSMGRGGCP